MSTVVEHRWYAMGTVGHLVLVGGDASAVDAAVGLVEHLEERWSRFRPTSDISRANAAGGAPVAVGPETIDAVGRALAARERTGGCFDPTVGRAVAAAGYDRSFEDLPPVPAEGPADPAGAAVDVDPVAGTIAVEPGARLDLGAIGKGLAADLVVEALLGRDGVAGACVNLGGDLRVAGVAPGPRPDAWGIAVEGTEALLDLDEGGVATSTVARRWWPTPGGGVAHHVIDARTGRPAATPVRSATAVASTAADAEVASTLALLQGWSEGTVLVVDHDGTTRYLP